MHSFTPSSSITTLACLFLPFSYTFFPFSLHLSYLYPQETLAETGWGGGGDRPKYTTLIKPPCHSGSEALKVRLGQQIHLVGHYPTIRPFKLSIKQSWTIQALRLAKLGWL
jgi:hypothetical protein